MLGWRDRQRDRQRERRVLVEGGVILVPHSSFDLCLALLLLLPVGIHSVIVHLLHRPFELNLRNHTNTRTVVAGSVVQWEG